MMRSESPCSSRFPGDVFSQKSRKAVGHGHRDTEVVQLRTRPTAHCRIGRAVRSRRSAFERNGSAMTHACCANCRIRLTPATSAYVAACPVCGEPLQPLNEPSAAMGYRLFAFEDAPYELPEAIEVSMPIPDSGPRPS